MFQVAPCPVAITPEHSLQISGVHLADISMDNCVTSVSNGDSASAVYCSNENFCGLDLSPNKTSELKFLTQKTCFIYLKNLTLCDQLDQQLQQYGYLFLLFQERAVFEGSSAQQKCSDLKLFYILV